MPNTNTKLTCKYEIQIENEKEFRVAQKIIGSRVNFLDLINNLISSLLGM